MQIAMRFGFQLLFVLCLAFGFQSGIVAAAASGHRLACLERLTVVEADPVEKDGTATEIPAPSCKSMTLASHTPVSPRYVETRSQRQHSSTDGQGLWRTLQIDEPPKHLIV